MTVKMKPPAVPAFPYPPPDGSPRTVTTADNWESLRKLVRRLDAWDIIYYNFRTWDPEEVNWYLNHLVGCTLPAADGKNFRFGRNPGDPPKSLVIYMPPAMWEAPPKPDDEQARLAVINVLAGPIAQFIHFDLTSFSLRKHDLAEVLDLVVRRRIRVEYDPKLKDRAFYHASGRFRDTISTGFKEPTARDEQSLILHECVHAVFDRRKVHLTLAQSEAVAYIAQSIYKIKCGLDPLSINPLKVAIFFYAADLARKILAGTPVDQPTLDKLYLSILFNSIYLGKSSPLFDGIPD